MNKLADDLDKLIDVIKPAPVPGVITWMSALSEPVRFSTGLGEGALKPRRLDR
jgi:hypothetical protein